MTAHTRTCPPTAAEIRTAMARCTPCGDYEYALAMHLAAPVDAPLGMAVYRDGAGVWYLDDAAVRPTGDPAADAATLADLAHTDGSRYLDLSGTDPVAWCKLLPSGVHQVLFGADRLLGARHIVAEAQVPAAMVFAVARQEYAGQLAVPQVFATDEGVCLLEGGEDWLTVRTGG